MLQRRLDKVEVQRTQMRRARVRSELPRIALVGYTNAGKSTLFNALTGADAYADDRLFATLDPTVRRIALPTGSVVLADTVGFVRDLPHELVAAFRSTLSEAREADLLLHVIDAADPLREERSAQVDAVLNEIGAGEIPQLLVYNKIDKVGIDEDMTNKVGAVRPAEDDQVNGFAQDAAVDGAEEPRGIEPRHDRPGGDQHDAVARDRVWISARNGIGLELLRTALAANLGLRRIVAELRLPPSAGRLRARLHALDAIRGEFHDEHGWTLAIDLPAADAIRLASDTEGAPLRELLPVVAAS